DTYTGPAPSNRWGNGKLRVQPSAVAVGPVAARFGFASLSPNPVRGSVRFRVSLSEQDLDDAMASLHLRIYDVRGREIASLQPSLVFGGQTLTGNGITRTGASVPSGMYTAQLDVGSHHALVRFVRFN